MFNGQHSKHKYKTGLDVHDTRKLVKLSHKADKHVNSHMKENGGEVILKYIFWICGFERESIKKFNPLPSVRLCSKFIQMWTCNTS